MLPAIVIGAHPKRDDSAPLELGVSLARRTGAPLAVVGTYWFDSTPQRTAGEDYSATLQQSIGRVVEETVGETRLEAPVEVRVTAGSPAYALRETAERVGAGMIVVGSTHRGRLGRIAAGTTADKVLDGAPCPVMIAPRGFRCTRTPVGRVGVAFVETPGGWSALAAGAAIARQTGAQLIAYTVTDAGTKDRDRTRADAAVRDAIAGVAGDLDCEARVLKGGVEGLVFESRELDFLVRGCRSAGRMLPPLAREVPSRLATEAECPVLVVPPGREGPLVALFASGDAEQDGAALVG